MNWVLWVLIIIIGLGVILYLSIRLYSYVFLKKVTKANNEILSLLENGLLESFKQNKPYDEIKEDYCKLIDNLDIFCQYVHFVSLREEKKYDRKSDCVMMQYLEEDGKKIARMHLRAFPITSLLEKLKPKEELINAFKIVENTLKTQNDLEYIEFITHNRMMNDFIVRRIIEQNDLNLDYIMHNQYEIGYFPWIYSEWIMIYGGKNPKSKEVYSKLRKINCPLYVKLTRKQGVHQ